MDDDVVFFAMVQRYNIYFKYVSLHHDIWIVMVLSHPRRISTGPFYLGTWIIVSNSLLEYIEREMKFYQLNCS